MLLIYRCLINILFPLIIIITFLRVFLKKEDIKRYKEKLFVSSFNASRDTSKKLIWFHVASIGEFKSITPIIKELNKTNKYEFLITSVTLSSAQLIYKDFFNEKNISHRFFPFDKLTLVKKFLNEWSPELIIFVDSEIWPNFIFEIKSKKIPLAIINGRITKKTFEKWMFISSFAKKIFSSFDLCLPSSFESQKYLEKLNAKNIRYIGNLKFAYPIEVKKLNIKNEKFLINKKFWCAASTHKGEEIFCLKTHLILKKVYKDIISIIIPRHINRSDEINKLCNRLNLNSQILSDGQLITKGKEVIIINSFGELPSYFKNSKSVFIGKSISKKLKKVGGQNPIEAAKLDCKIYHGPYVSNFKEIYELLKSYKISEEVKTEHEFANKLLVDLKNPKIIQNKNTVAINDLGKKILNNSINEINKILI
jgi:3-deoxy-D-manno-octulosonic-acid transferase